MKVISSKRLTKSCPEERCQHRTIHGQCNQQFIVIEGKQCLTAKLKPPLVGDKVIKLQEVP